jgi:hypothetical protein
LERSPPISYPKDDLLSFHQLQAKGTHNSYHQEPQKPLDASWEYTQAPLETQLSEQGIRQLELDLHLKDDGTLEVFHIPVADEETSCRYFEDCLIEVCRWSAQNSSHSPILIWLEPKDDLDGSNGYLRLAGAYSLIEAVIESVFLEDQLYAPDDWKRGKSSLSEATQALGPPFLGELRGRVLFGLLDGGEHRENYLAETPDLSGRLLFPDTDSLEQNWAALRKDADPSETPGLLSAGLVVTDNVDQAGQSDADNSASRDAGLAAGVNFAASDLPGESEGYWMELEGGEPVRCNPVSAPADCVSSDLE